MNKDERLYVKGKQQKGNGKKKKFSKFKDKRERNSRPLGVTPNSPSWYYPSPEIQKLAAAVNFNFRNGDAIHYADNVNLLEQSDIVNRNPGVCVNPICHVPGIANSPTDAINDASRANMNRIREVINANRDYEMPDLVKYLLSCAEVFAWVEFLKLIYRICRKYNPLNKYTPSLILQGLHIDSSDVTQLGIQLKFYINTLIYRIQNLRVPKDIPLLSAWIEDYKHVFVDEDIAKAQYIVNVPQYIWKFVINSSTGKSELIPKDFYSTFTLSSPAKYADLVNFTEDLLSQLVNDEDCAIITGDIMKAYSSFYTLSEVQESDIIEFEYSKEFLEKWHNSCIAPTGLLSLTQDWKITEDTSTYLDPFIVFDPVFKWANQAQFDAARRGAGNRMLDFYDREITSDQIINASLWQFTFKIEDAATFKLKFEALNAWIINPPHIHFLDKSGTYVVQTYPGSINVSIPSANQVQMSSGFLNLLTVLSKFNYYPFSPIMVVANAVTASDVGLRGLIGELGNYTIVDKQVMKNINTCVMYGLYNINYLLKG